MSDRGNNVVRLGCAEQAAIAEELRQYWQHVVDEGVPEHLRGLVLRFAGELERGDGELGEAAVQTGGASGVIVLADLRPSDCESSP